MLSDRYDMTDEEWHLLKQVLPADLRGPKRKDDRKVMNGICVHTLDGNTLA